MIMTHRLAALVKALQSCGIKVGKPCGVKEIYCTINGREFFLKLWVPDKRNKTNIWIQKTEAGGIGNSPAVVETLPMLCKQYAEGL